MTNLATKATTKITIENNPTAFWADKSYAASWCAVDAATVDGVIYALGDQLVFNAVGQLHSSSLFLVIGSLAQYGIPTANDVGYMLGTSGVSVQFAGKPWITRAEVAASAGVSVEEIDAFVVAHASELTLNANGEFSPAAVAYTVGYLGRAGNMQAAYSYLIFGDFGTRVRLAKLGGYVGSVI
jgi:hypothetical protein